MTGSAHLLGGDPSRLRRVIEADPKLSLFYALMIYRKEREHMLLAYHESMYKVELMGRLSLKNEWLLNPLIDTETIKRMKEIDERLRMKALTLNCSFQP